MTLDHEYAAAQLSHAAAYAHKGETGLALDAARRGFEALKEIDYAERHPAPPSRNFGDPGDGPRNARCRD